MRHPNRNGKRAQRRQSAAERQAAYDALSPMERIKQANMAPGRSLRQRAKLERLSA